MRYCVKCGKEIVEGAAFCTECGAPLEKEISVALAQSGAFNEENDREEREFLENTHRLLRWELKAWSIASKFWIIFGIIYAAFFLLYTLIGIIISVEEQFLGGFFIGFGFIMALFLGGSFIGIGVVNKKAAEKLPQYINTVYTDLSISYKRCGSVGMLVFNAIFGVVSPIFFIINFVRMKTNRKLIEKIINSQKVQ